jgi:hypothetical protein
MPQSSSPHPPFVLDAATLTQALCDSPTNQNISCIEWLLDNGAAYTSTEVRGDVKDYDEKVWSKYHLNRINIISRRKDISKTIGALYSTCEMNGINPLDRGLAPKLLLICIAKLNSATIVSVDSSDSSISLRNLCAIFAIPFYFYENLIGVI